MNTPVPMFELVGPPCETPGCKGVLVDSISMKTKEFFHKCSACGGTFHRMSLADKVEWAHRTIHRVFAEEKRS